MSDPLSSGAGKVAEEMLKEVQSAVQQQDQIAKTQEVDPSVAFQDVMQTQQVGGVQGVQGVQARPDVASDVLRAARSQQVPSVPAIGQSVDSSPAMGGLKRVLEDVMQGQNKLEEIVGLAMSGRNFSTPELLALQAGVYRFTQELELTSKVLEKATATVKQTMNTQV